MASDDDAENFVDGKEEQYGHIEHYTGWMSIVGNTSQAAAGLLGHVMCRDRIE